MKLRGQDPLADPEPLIRRVYSYVAYIVGDGADAEDITSATMERALRYRRSYDARKGTPIAWLLGIARSRIAERPRAPVEQLDDDAEVADVDDAELGAVDRLALRAAVASLGPRDRELVALRFGADLTARQIGTILDMRPNAVEVALHRALSRLRALLA
jgi:RNA polymerase sigma-70 factor (ECF subfamily)